MQYTLEELDRMTPEQRNDILMRAVKVEATVIVHDRHGRPKYDDPKLAGSYNEDKL